MTDIAAELEILAKDCEECAEDCEAESNYGDRRAWQSVAYRIRHALSRLTTPPLPDEIAALTAETERALREAPQDILRRNLAAIRALAQENERLKAALDEKAEAERDAIRAKMIEECAGTLDGVLPEQYLYAALKAIRALAQTDETKSNVAAIANSHI